MGGGNLYVNNGAGIYLSIWFMIKKKEKNCR